MFGKKSTSPLIRHLTKSSTTKTVRFPEWEWDSDNDGKLDYWEIYKKGKLVRKGVDGNGDGEPDPDKWVDIEDES